MKFTTPCRSFFQPWCFLIVLFASACLPREGFGWGEPHFAITKAALDVLPSWQQKILGDELTPLWKAYCIIPDKVYGDKENAKFAAMDTHPGEVYMLRLHLPEPQQPDNLATLHYFMDKAVAALKAGKTGDGARFMGTICHVLEDFGSPAHTIPGDNMFTLFQQFMPPPERLKGKLLHSLIENGQLNVTIKDYRPQLLGVTVEEASWRLLHRVHEGIINARSTTIPIIQALYADDAKAVTAGQMKAAVVDAQVVADAFYTILCLSAEKFDPEEAKSLRTVGIASFFPLEAVNLYYPQSDFYSAPHWGHATTGLLMEDGSNAVPLKLRIQEQEGMVEKEFTDGISTGIGRPLTWIVPKGVYQRFTVLAGLHPELGANGRVEFTILGDGKPLASAVVSGSEPAHAFDCDISGVAQVQLAVAHRGVNSKSDYAIWAHPCFLKKP